MTLVIASFTYGERQELPSLPPLRLSRLMPAVISPVVTLSPFSPEKEGMQLRPRATYDFE